MKWEIMPLVGIGPLRFGMDRDDVARELNNSYPITAQHKEFDGTIREYRGLKMPICIYEENVLQGVDTNNLVEEVIFKENNIYLTDPKTVLLLLKKEGGDALCFGNMVLFSEISINTSGFYDEKSNTFCQSGLERSLGMFRPRAFDRALKYFSDIKIPD